MIYIQQVVRVRRRLLQGRGDEDFGGSVGRSVGRSVLPRRRRCRLWKPAIRIFP